jgi:hypothetical protein
MSKLPYHFGYHRRIVISTFKKNHTPRFKNAKHCHERRKMQDHRFRPSKKSQTLEFHMLLQ